MFAISQLSNICRTCNKERPQLFSIFEDKIMGNSITIDKMLSAVSGIEINQQDSFPQHICSNCAKRLEITYKFLNKYRKSRREQNKQLQQIKRSKSRKRSSSITRKDIAKLQLEDKLTQAATCEVNNSSDSCQQPANQTCHSLTIQQQFELLGPSDVVDNCNIRLENIEISINPEEIEAKFQCSMCTKTFLSKNALKLHAKIVHKNLANKPSYHQNLSTSHAQVEESIPNERSSNIFCELCNKGFQTNKALILHGKISHKHK